VDHESSSEDTIKLKSKPRWGCLLAPLSMAILYGFISYQLSPPDWIEVTVGPLPIDAQDLCVIVEDSRGVGALPLYHSKVFPFTADPFMHGEFYGGLGRPSKGDFSTASVQWREAKRYGVLIRRRDGQWRIHWLESGEIRRPSVMRYFVGGNNDAALHLPEETRAQIPPPEFLEQLGLSRKNQ
jgi:hypothetical protein